MEEIVMQSILNQRAQVSTLIVLSSWLLASGPAHADEFDVNMGPGAMICDKAESVVLTMNGEQQADCGILTTSTGMPVTVTIIGELHGKPLARFDFHNPTPWGNQIQYGWWAGTIPASGVEA